MRSKKIREFTEKELLEQIARKRARIEALSKEIGHIQTYLLLKNIVGGEIDDL